MTPLLIKLPAAEAVRLAPWALTPEQLSICVEECAGVTLQYAAKRLTPEQFDMCVRKAPVSAYRFPDAKARLSLPQIRFIAETTPRGHLEFPRYLLEAAGYETK